MMSDQDQPTETSTETSNEATRQTTEEATAPPVQATGTAEQQPPQKTSNPVPKPPEPERTMTAEEVAEEVLQRATIAIGSQRKKAEPDEADSADTPPTEAPKPKPDPTALGEPCLVLAVRSGRSEQDICRLVVLLLQWSAKCGPRNGSG